MFMEKECLSKKKQLQDNHLCQVKKRKNDDKDIDEGESLSIVPILMKICWIKALKRMK